jgi:hypothetical protein
MESLMQAFVSISAMAVILITPITSFLKDTVFGELRGWGARILSWAIGILLAFIGAYFDLGMFAELEGQIAQFWWQLVLIGIFAGVEANGIYSIKELRPALKWLFKRFGVDILPELDNE